MRSSQVPASDPSKGMIAGAGVAGGDGWESNPPGTPQQRPANAFEERGEHQLSFIPSVLTALFWLSRPESTFTPMRITCAAANVGEASGVPAVAERRPHRVGLAHLAGHRSTHLRSKGGIPPPTCHACGRSGTHSPSTIAGDHSSGVTGRT